MKAPEPSAAGDALDDAVDAKTDKGDAPGCDAGANRKDTFKAIVQQRGPRQPLTATDYNPALGG